MPGELYIIDLNLLNWETEEHDIRLERDYFEKHPEDGRFINWEIFGDIVNPMDVPEKLRKSMALDLRKWQHDKEVSRIPELHDWISTKNAQTNRTVAYYIHCEAGKDRTGEISGSYEMQYMNWTYEQSVTVDYKIAGRPIRELSLHALNWYCWFLSYSRGFPMDCAYKPPKK